MNPENSQSIQIPATIQSSLRRVRRRMQWVRLGRGLLLTASVLLGTMMLAMLIDWLVVFFSHNFRLALTCSALALAAAFFIIHFLKPLLFPRRLESVAAEVDRAVPELQERWSTVTELAASQDPPEMRGAPSLIEQVRREAEQAHELVQPERIVSSRPMRRQAWVLGIVAAVLLLAAVLAPRSTWVLLKRFWFPGKDFSLSTLTAVTGDRAVAKGEPLTIEVKADGRLHSTAKMYFKRASVSEEMTVSRVAGAESAFVWKTRAVKETFQYRFRSGDGQTEWHTITAVERPAISEMRFRVSPPSYSKLEVTNLKTLPGATRALEGSLLELDILSNKPLDRLMLKINSETSESLQRVKGQWYRYTTTLEKNLTLSPVLMDSFGLTNLAPPVCNVIVYADKPPVAEVVTPQDQTVVKPDDTLTIDYKASDDFGVRKAELVVMDQDHNESTPLKVIPLPLDNQQDARNVAGQVELNLKEFNLKNGMQLSYAIRVTDTREASSLSTHSDEEQKPSEDGSSSEMQMAQAGEQQPQKNQQNQSQQAGADQQNQQSQMSGEEQKRGEREIASANNQNQNQIFAEQQNPAQQNSQAGQNNQSQANQNSQQNQSNQNSQASQSNQNDSANQNNQKGQNNSGNQNQNDSHNQNARNEQNNSEQQSNQQNQNNPANQNENKQANKQNRQGEMKGQPDNQSGGKNQSGGGQSDGDKIEKVPDKKQRKDQDPGQQFGSKMTASLDNKSRDPVEKKMGSSPPPNSMTERMSPNKPPNTAVSKKHAILVDEFAGSFQGKAREKLELAIESYVARLKKSLTDGGQGNTALREHLRAAKKWEDPQARQLTGAHDKITEAESTIKELEKVSVNTPYAFIGFQLQAIGHGHVTPAGTNMINAGGLSTLPERQSKELDQAGYHITQALALLDALTKQYEVVRNQEKVADKLSEIAKMHQIFIEDMQSFLHSIKPGLNPRESGKMLEVSDEYAEKLREKLEKMKALMDELAKVMAQDPELMQRMLANSKKEGTTLRDQLTLLSRRQGGLYQRTGEWVDKGPQVMQPILNMELIGEQQKLAIMAAELNENTRLWIPRDLGTTHPLFRQCCDLANEIALSSGEAARLFSANQTDQSLKTAAEAVDKLEWLDKFIHDTSDLAEKNKQLTLYVTNRSLETRKLTALQSGWREKVANMKEGKFARWGEIDQFHLMNDTVELGDKIDRIGPMLAQMSGDVAKKVKDLIYKVKVETVSYQITAGKAFSLNKLADARQAEGLAVASFVSAEKMMNELFDIVEAHLAKNATPPKPGDMSPLPTLEELVKLIESDLKACEKLGIAGPMLNISANFDWFLPDQGEGFGGGGGGGMGSGGGGSSGAAAATAAARQAGRGRPIDQRMAQAMAKAAQGYAQNAQQQLQQALQAAHARMMQQYQAKNEADQAGQPNAVAARPTRPEGRDWNVLASKLKNELQQGRDNTPPEQYRQAIDAYFRAIYDAAEGAETSTQ